MSRRLSCQRPVHAHMFIHERWQDENGVLMHQDLFYLRSKAALAGFGRSLERNVARQDTALHHWTVVCWCRCSVYVTM